MAAPWWNSSYGYRKPLPVVNNETSTLAAGYVAEVTIDTATLVTGGKMQADGDDLRVVYYNGATTTELDRHVLDINTASTVVLFKTQAAIASSATDSGYFLYYGYGAATSPPSTKTNIYSLWNDCDAVTGMTTWGTVTPSSSIITVASGGGFKIGSGVGPEVQMRQLRMRINPASGGWSNRDCQFGFQVGAGNGWPCAYECCFGGYEQRHFICAAGTSSQVGLLGNVGNNTATNDNGTPFTPTDSYKVWKFKWGNGKNEIYEGTTLRKSSTRVVGGPIGIRSMDIVVYSVGGGSLLVDWFAVSPYTHNEPTTTAGTEEPQGGGTGAFGTLTATLETLSGGTRDGDVKVDGDTTQFLAAISPTLDGDVKVKGDLTKTVSLGTCTLQGRVRVKGTASSALAAASVTGDGDVKSKGTLSSSLSAVTPTLEGDVSVKGTLSANLGTLAGTLEGDTKVSGTLSKTLADLTGSAGGRVQVRGTLAGTLEGISGNLSGGFRAWGTLTASLEAVSITAEATIPRYGTATNTLANITATLDADVKIKGDLDKSLDAIPTASLVGTAPAKGTLEGELGAASLAGAGNVGVLISSGGLIQTLEGVARTADGDVKVDGDLTQTLGGIAGTLTAKAKAIGSLSQTLTDASFVGQGSAPAGGTLSQTLDGITIDADGTAPVTAVGTLSQTLDAVSLTGEGENAGYTGLSGTLTADLGALTGNIQGRVRIGGQLEKSLANAVTHQVYRGTLVATLADLFTPQLTMRFRVLVRDEGRNTWVWKQVTMTREELSGRRTVTATDVALGYVDIRFRHPRGDNNYFPDAVVVGDDGVKTEADCDFHSRGTSGFRVYVAAEGTLAWRITPASQLTAVTTL